MDETLIIKPKLPPTCGSCAWSRTQPDLMQVECRGAPPTPVVMGVVNTPRGMAPNLQLLYPVLPRAEPACGLYRLRTAAEDLVEHEAQRDAQAAAAPSSPVRVRAPIPGA